MIEEIFKELKKEGFVKKVKRKVNYFFEFNNIQLYGGLYDDKSKKGLKHLIKQEKKVEKESKLFLGKKILI